MSVRIQTQARPWAPTRALALARQPGKHKHPTVPGFYLDVSPKGKAVWRYKFRGPDGKEVSGTLGTVAAVSDGVHGLSLDDALKQYEAKRAAAFSVASKSGLTLSAAFERWLREHKKRGGGNLSQATVKYYTDGYECYLKPDAADWVLARITTDDWVRLLRKVKTRSPSQARGMMWLVRAIYAHFIELEVLDKNPLSKQLVRDEFAGRETKVRRTSHIHTLDLPRFVDALPGLRQRTSRDALWVLLLTGWRRSAVLRMQWDDVDLDRGIYQVQPGYPGWKGYVGPMVLNDYALDFLRERKEHPASGHSPYVFPGRHGDLDAKPYLADVRGSLKTACAGLGYPVSTHDLRRTFVTIAELVLSGNLRLIGRLVGHRHGKIGQQDVDDDATAMTLSYVARNLDRERAASRTVAEAILEIGGVFPLSDEIATLLRAAGMDSSALTLQDINDDEGSDD